MKYVVQYLIIFGDKEYTKLSTLLRKHGLAVPDRERILPEGQLTIRFEKTDPRRHDVVKELRRIDIDPIESYRPSFEPWELEQAELARLQVEGFCGEEFETWAKRLKLPPGARVMDKRAMGKMDVARTYAWKEIVIAERVREILEREGLTGWLAEPIQHRNPQKDTFPAMYQLLASSELPPLSPETEIYVDKHEGVEEGDILYGTTALIERGPLCYRRGDLTRVADVNRTHEVFLEVTVGHPYFIFSQRARQAFLRHRVRGDFVWEPVVILE